MVLAFQPPHTLLNESLRLQFPFVFRRLQSLQLLLPGSPLLSGFRFLASLGFHFHGLAPLPLLFLTSAVFAPFRSLQFWILTTQPLFLPFPFLPVSASQWLPQCAALTFAPSAFPVLSCLVSRAFFPGFGTWLRCMFPFTLPRFAPTAVPRVLAFFSGSLRPLLFRHFPFRFCFPSGYLAFCFFLSALPGSASQWLPRCAASALASSAFLLRSGLISHAFLPDSRTQFSVGFLSSFPASLPQLFDR